MTSPVIQYVSARADRDWVRQAACRDADPAQFTPTIAVTRSKQYFQERAEKEAAARRWCTDCPVLAACAAAADDRREEGVWGGALRHRDHHVGRYVADLLIEQAPPSTRTRGRTAEVAS